MVLVLYSLDRTVHSHAESRYIQYTHSGGIVGLSLSHALKRQGISSIVFERDVVQARNQGWALSIHWLV